jgi:hypothetical protein
MKLFRAMKWLVVLIVCVLIAHMLIRVLESTLVMFFGVMQGIAKFSTQSYMSGMTASGLESLAPKIPQY